MRKHTKAGLVSGWGQHPRTFAAMWDEIPASLRSSLTGQQLGELILLMKGQQAFGANRELDDAVEIGAIYRPAAGGGHVKYTVVETGVVA